MVSVDIGGIQNKEDIYVVVSVKDILKGGIKMLKNKVFLLLFLFLIIPFVASTDTVTSLGVFKLGESIDLKQTCGNSTQACTECNISSVLYPNSTNIIEDVGMTKRGIDFNYTLEKSFVNTDGQYITNGFCTAGSELQVWSYTFEVTNTGFLQSTPRAIFYLILSFGVLLSFLLSLYFQLTLDWRNERDDDGLIVKVTKTKYINLLLTLVTYPLFLWWLNILISISNNFVEITIFSGFFEFAFTVLLWLSFPLFVFIFVAIFFNSIRDSNIIEEMKTLGRTFR